MGSYGKFPLVYTFNEQVKQWQTTSTLQKYSYIIQNGTNGKLLFQHFLTILTLLLLLFSLSKFVLSSGMGYMCGGVVHVSKVQWDRKLPLFCSAESAILIVPRGEAVLFESREIIYFEQVKKQIINQRHRRRRKSRWTINNWRDIKR